jgi:hypothetical protein
MSLEMQREAWLTAAIVLAPGECWNWPWAKSQGYGNVIDEGQSIRAHRWAWKRLVGPLPVGLTLDHLCRNRLCVNPSHLEAVTNRENILRGEAPSAQAARRSTCKRGHPYDGANTRICITKDGKRSRVCRTCQSSWEQQRRANG